MIENKETLPVERRTITNSCVKCLHFVERTQQCGHPKNTFETKETDYVGGIEKVTTHYINTPEKLRKSRMFFGGGCGTKGKWFERN